MGLDIGQLQEENKRLGENGSGNYLDNFVKMPEGSGHVTVRLLGPANKGMFNRAKSEFYQATRTHRLNNRSYHCPKELPMGEARWSGKCPICDYYNWLWQSSEKKSSEEATTMQAQARQIKPIERYYYNCIVRQQMNEKTNEMEKNVGPKILSIGKTLHGMIIRGIVGDETVDEAALGDVTDSKTGRDFKIIKTMRQSGRESYPNYSDSKFQEATILGDPDQIEKWSAELHDLVSLRVIKGTDELKHALKVHLGLEQDTANTDFDPTEFQQQSADDEPAAATKVVTKAVIEEPKATSTSAKKSEPLADSEFMSELADLKKVKI